MNAGPLLMRSAATLSVQPPRGGCPELVVRGVRVFCTSSVLKLALVFASTSFVVEKKRGLVSVCAFISSVH